MNQFTPMTVEAVLEFERTTSQDGKASRIRETFGLAPARYYQRLNTIIDSREALEADPQTTKRLIRIRDAQVARRRAAIYGGAR